jgi:hypothetical protein
MYQRISSNLANLDRNSHMSDCDDFLYTGFSPDKKNNNDVKERALEFDRRVPALIIKNVAQA